MAWCKSRSEHSKRRFERMSEEEKNIEHKRRSKHYKNNSQINIKQVKERKEKIIKELCKLKKELKHEMKDPESLFCNSEYKKLVPKYKKKNK